MSRNLRNCDLFVMGQVYMQWQEDKELEKLSKLSEEAETKWLETAKRYYLGSKDGDDKANIMSTKLHSIEGLISTIGLPDQLKQIIISYVTPILEDENVIDTENPFPHLPTPLERLIKLHLCLPLLRTVSLDPPMLIQKKKKSFK